VIDNDPIDGLGKTPCQRFYRVFGRGIHNLYLMAGTLERRHGCRRLGADRENGFTPQAAQNLCQRKASHNVPGTDLRRRVSAEDD
jgi:hypothetical protein